MEPAYVYSSVECGRGFYRCGGRVPGFAGTVGLQAQVEVDRTVAYGRVKLVSAMMLWRWRAAVVFWGRGVRVHACY